MIKDFSSLKHCPVCGSDLFGGVQTSMGYRTKEFECVSEFILYKNGFVEVGRPCSHPSNFAAYLLQRDNAAKAGTA